MNPRFMPVIKCSPNAVLKPQPGSPWADTMVLNPAILHDPASSRLHMLFRASGPWPQARVPGKALPFPIFLGYAWSDDQGVSWTADWGQPALAPALEQDRDLIWRGDGRGVRTLNYANGGLEDPRLFWLAGRLLLTVACRVFPPGPYWDGDPDPTIRPAPEARPEWAKGAADLGNAVTGNVTVTVLYEVDLDRLAARDYPHAFAYLTHLTDPELGDNRDAYLFPERLKVDGRLQYVLLHRPAAPAAYGYPEAPRNSMLVAVADSLYDFATPKSRHGVLAIPQFDWERERIGGSWPPLSLGNGEWFMGYHGKRDAAMGYTQSFMILREDTAGGPPRVAHRCSDRLLYARQPWELPRGMLACPCIFTCSGIVVDGELVMAYGAADEQIGIARVNFSELTAYVRQFDFEGRLGARCMAGRDRPSKAAPRRRTPKQNGQLKK